MTELQANVLACDATISTCSRGGELQHALGFIEEMESHGHEVNVITYDGTIRTCTHRRAVAARPRRFRGDAVGRASGDRDHVRCYHPRLLQGREFSSEGVSQLFSANAVVVEHLAGGQQTVECRW